jgi:hypothetical protein
MKYKNVTYFLQKGLHTRGTLAILTKRHKKASKAAGRESAGSQLSGQVGSGKLEEAVD